ncbi:hypothetical protein chiPu_0008249 [Chiloscyllium punctatum]|uniref:Uncharacterized protein n=1 Tax=Chiloscyllium punctatum TaxID=137246 RepID=A0A401SHC1_CHIPU|nr:hypothetical protein [Chiloscyllium punctatum]
MMLCCACGRRSRDALFRGQKEVTWCSVSCARRSRDALFRGQKEVTWGSVSRAKEGHVRSDIREREKTENRVGSTANQKTIPPQ